jgi:transposase
VVNPYAARSFARATLIRGKVDAQVLARYVLHCAPAPYTPPRPAALELRAITRRSSALLKTRTAEKNCLHAAQTGGDPRCVLTSIHSQLAHLTGQIAALERAALKLLQQDEQLGACYGLLLSVKGIAKRSALQLLGELGVLPEGLSKGQWVTMAGLDPQPQESGKSLNAPRHISRQGNRALRRALFMPALCAAHRSGQARLSTSTCSPAGKSPCKPWWP